MINVDRDPAYPVAIRELKAEETLPKWTRLRQCRYLNNVVEQHHRFRTAWKTLQGIEAMHMINKGRARWLPHVVRQVKFIGKLFAIASY